MRSDNHFLHFSISVGGSTDKTNIFMLVTRVFDKIIEIKQFGYLHLNCHALQGVDTIRYKCIGFSPISFSFSMFRWVGTITKKKYFHACDKHAIK
jgi:hypothetical protein